MTDRFDRLYFVELGMCECGRPDEVEAFVLEILDAQASYRDTPQGGFEAKESRQHSAIKNTDADVIFEFVMHVFEHAGFVEHGSSVYGSWLTEKGRKLISELKARASAEGV